MNILITGVGGLLGSNFSKFLLDNTDYNVIGIDNFSVNGSALIPVRWPGGITPTVTVTANRSDIY